MEKTCKVCGSTDQVVSTQDGDFCREHYRAYKRGKSRGTCASPVRCGNCGEMTVPDRRCVRCGHTLTSTGDVLRVGGYEDC